MCDNRLAACCVLYDTQLHPTLSNIGLAYQMAQFVLQVITTVHEKETIQHMFRAKQRDF